MIDQLAALLAEEGAPVCVWYMSFADADLPEGSQWLGACLVKARGLATATVEAHQRGCNPGGEIMAAPMQADFEIPDKWMNRLLSRDDLSAMDREVWGNDGELVMWDDR